MLATSHKPVGRNVPLMQCPNLSITCNVSVVVWPGAMSPRFQTDRAYPMRSKQAQPAPGCSGRPAFLWAAASPIQRSHPSALNPKSSCNPRPLIPATPVPHLNLMSEPSSLSPETLAAGPLHLKRNT
eukprot:363060-Chlamydomonas_euryale.AAC.4